MHYPCGDRQGANTIGAVLVFLRVFSAAFDNIFGRAVNGDLEAPRHEIN